MQIKFSSFIPVIAAAVMSLPVCAAENANAAEPAPELKDNQIVFGSKKIDLQQDGQLKISADGAMIAQIYAYYSVNNLKTKQTAWGTFDAPVSSLKREGNKYVWELKRKVGSEIWKAADQTLTILPDNRLQLDIRLYPPTNPDLQFRGERASQWIVLPLDTAEGAKHQFNGKTYLLKRGEKVPAHGDSSRDKKLESVYYLGNPAREFKVDAVRSKFCWCNGTVYPTAKSVRYTFTMQDRWSGTMILDFRKKVQP